MTIMDNCATYSSNSRSFPDRELQNKGDINHAVLCNRHKNSKTEMSIPNIRDMLELPILGVIPEEKKVQSALIQKEELIHAYPKCKASIEYKRISAKIIGHEGYNEKASFCNRLFN